MVTLSAICSRATTILLLLCGVASGLAISAPAQSRSTGAASGNRISTVSFVGCKSDGQIGPLPSPTAAEMSLPIDTVAAKRMIYI